MHRLLRLTEPAKDDMRKIWQVTASTYEAEQADKYQALINQALEDLREDPERPTSKARPELGEGRRTYRIDLSKARSGTGIKSPRHLIVYTLKHAGETIVLRILHDRMEPTRHLPEE